MLDLSSVKVFAADDGLVYVGVPVSSLNFSRTYATIADFAVTLRALKYKVRTAELTRCKVHLSEVA
jgi:hypothetical protein